MKIKGWLIFGYYQEIGWRWRVTQDTFFRHNSIEINNYLLELFIDHDHPSLCFGTSLHQQCCGFQGDENIPSCCQKINGDVSSRRHPGWSVVWWAIRQKDYCEFPLKLYTSCLILQQRPTWSHKECLLPLILLLVIPWSDFCSFLLPSWDHCLDFSVRSTRNKTIALTFYSFTSRLMSFNFVESNAIRHSFHHITMKNSHTSQPDSIIFPPNDLISV